MARKDTITVKAGANGPVFRAGVKRQLDENGKDTTAIGEEPVEVPNTRYYRRRIQVGDLVEVEVVAKIAEPTNMRAGKE